MRQARVIREGLGLGLQEVALTIEIKPEALETMEHGGTLPYQQMRALTRHYGSLLGKRVSVPTLYKPVLPERSPYREWPDRGGKETGP